MKDSVILNDCDINAGAVIDSSFLGIGVKVNEGVKIEECYVMEQVEISEDIKGLTYYAGKWIPNQVEEI